MFSTLTFAFASCLNTFSWQTKPVEFDAKKTKFHKRYVSSKQRAEWNLFTQYSWNFFYGILRLFYFLIISRKTKIRNFIFVSIIILSSTTDASTREKLCFFIIQNQFEVESFIFCEVNVFASGATDVTPGNRILLWLLVPAPKIGIRRELPIQKFKIRKEPKEHLNC